jgi:predicted GIY-YIG superfamily endonuclease
VVTDIDSAKEDRKKCRVSVPNAQLTTNSSLVYFYEQNTLTFYIGLTLENKRLSKDRATKKWIQDVNGHLLCVYQTEEDGYHARSFEDAFFHINRQFFLDNVDKFPMGTKNKRYIKDVTKDVYFLAENCVNKKPALAMEILLNSTTDEDRNQFSNWKIPAYIREGLLWLKEN